MHPRPRCGFTLVELTTVFTIIVVLAAILFPVFARAREKARQSNCQSNLMQIGMALRVYASEHYGHLTPTDNDLWPLVPGCLADTGVLRCPSEVGVEALATRMGLPPQGAPGAQSAPPPIAPPPPGLAGRCDFIYRGGLCDDENPSLAVAGDGYDARHNDGSNYLFLDGHAKWMKAGSDTSPAGGNTGRIPGLRELRKLGRVSGTGAPVGGGGKEE